MLDIFPSCNPVKYQGKLTMQIWENVRKCNLGPNFGPLKFFSLVLLLLVRHFFKLSSYGISWKTNEPNFRKWQKKLISGLILVQIWAPKTFFVSLLLLDVRHSCRLSLYAISRKTMEPNLRNGKNLILGPILACLAQIWAPEIFFESFISTRC